MFEQLQYLNTLRFSPAPNSISISEALVRTFILNRLDYRTNSPYLTMADKAEDTIKETS